jgi:LmbE family N-acetylglucosaminyl deacetylase
VGCRTRKPGTHELRACGQPKHLPLLYEASASAAARTAPNSPNCVPAARINWPVGQQDYEVNRMRKGLNTLTPVCMIAMLLAAAGAPMLLADGPCLTQGSEREDAQSIPENRGAAALTVALRQLHTRASMLMIVAHPDDEDGATLAYESRSVGARVGLLTLNRGEGGANEMSSDFWDELGLVRTEELLQADRYYCATQFFTSAADYGFSKTLNEALDKWGGDTRVFSDVVRVVRMYRPLIISSVFVGGPSDGHGNHQAAGRWAQKVFTAAGDPNVFPDQIKAGLLPWNPYKEYAHAPFFRQVNGVQNYINGKFEEGPVSVNVKIPVGTYSPANGLTVQQISRTGLGFQKSQNGGGEVPAAGAAFSAYHRFGSRIPAADEENSFFDGIDVSLAGIATLAGNQEHNFLTDGLNKVNALVEQAIAGYKVDDPSTIASMLADGLSATNQLIAQVKSSSFTDEAKYNVLHELNVKRVQFNEALALSLSLSIAANVTSDKMTANPEPQRGFMRIDQPDFPMAVPGQRFHVLVHLADDGATAVNVEKVTLTLNGSTIDPDNSAGSVNGALDKSGVLNALFWVQIPEDASFTRPYFDRPSIDQAYYDVGESPYRNLPVQPYPLQAKVTFSYHGVPIELSEAVQTVQREVGAGTVNEPLPIGPAISVHMVQSAGVIPLTAAYVPVSVKIHNNVYGPAQGTVRLDLPDGWKSAPASAPFSFERDGQELIVFFKVLPANLKEQSYPVQAVATYDGHEFKDGYVQIGYPGLRPYFDYSKATDEMTAANVKVAPNLQIGYVAGSGDDVPSALEDLGIRVHFLTEDDLAAGDLDRYNEILVGVRAYAVREDLRTFNGRLMNYVKQGGVVVVQYQTPEFDHDFGPYPYVMTNNPEEVTDERSVVTILDPKNPAMRWPNAITEKDFEGWIEERGSKFLKTWDVKYEPLLETHDPGQDPQSGGMVIAHYGSGIYMYTAYAFYRQLPLGVPGAYRILANLLSLQKNPLFKTENNALSAEKKPAQKKGM